MARLKRSMSLEHGIYLHKAQRDPMVLISHVLFFVSSEHRNPALEAFIGEVETVRSMKGCHSFVPFLDPSNP
jgi:hypothetical protein